jgi:hypothetical protein
VIVSFAPPVLRRRFFEAASDDARLVATKATAGVGAGGAAYYAYLFVKQRNRAGDSEMDDKIALKGG